MLIQRLLGSRLNPRWRYALWLLVLLRLVLPALPESTLSIFQFTPPTPALLEDSITQRIFIPSTSLPAPTFHADIAPEAPPFTFYSPRHHLASRCHFPLDFNLDHQSPLRATGHKSPAISDPELCKLFAEAKAELGIQRTIHLIENSHVQSPAIMGLFQPTLLLPADVRQKFDATELRFIFLHDLAHLKRGDVIVQGLIALLQILHWFNPVLWFAFRRMRIDREPATDALVLSRTGEAEKERYGLMLIKLLEHFNQRHSLPTLVGILEDKDQFKRRFSLIAKFTRGAYGWSVLGVLLIGILSVACLTKSKATELLIAPKTDAKPNISRKVSDNAVPSYLSKGGNFGPPLPHEEKVIPNQNDPVISLGGSIIIFKLDPKDPTRAEKYLTVFQNSTYEGLNKLGGFVELGTSLLCSFRASDFSATKNFRPDHSWSVQTGFPVKNDNVEIALKVRLLDSDHIEITYPLEPNDAKGLRVGTFTSKWIQPIDKDCVVLLAFSRQSFEAPQSNSTDLGYFLDVFVRKDRPVGDHPLSASDRYVEAELSWESVKTPS
jgi:beta-lactamase regulating signal transducer with metallopeptidase domain